MVRYAAQHLLAKKDDRKAIGRSSARHLRVHFKNTHETAVVVQGMPVEKAISYLTDVQEHKQCVPFRRFNGGVGRTAQAKAFKATQGRWPVKSAKYLQRLIINAKSNAVVNELDTEDLFVKSIIVNQAPKTRRRTYRAHGRINPYQGHPCHVEVILSPRNVEVEKASEEVTATGGRRQRGQQRAIEA